MDAAPYGHDSRSNWITVRGMDAYSPGFYLDGLPMRNSGPLNGDGTLLYRLTGVLRDGQLPVGGTKDDYAYLAPSLTRKPSADTRLTVLSQFGRIRSGVYTRGMPAYGSLLPTAIGTYIPASAFAAMQGFDHDNQDQWLVGYAVEHHVSSVWTVRQKARYASIKTDIQQIVLWWLRDRE